MLNRAHRALREHRVTVYTAALLCLLFFHMLWYVNFFLAESLAGTFFLYPIPVLAAFYLYFRGLRDGPEIRLLLLFSLWLLITRVLNGDPALVREGYLVLDSLMMALFLSLGLLLDKRGRRICLNVVSVAAGAFFLALGLLGIYVFVTGATLVNPLTEAVTTARLGNVGFYRLTLLGVNPNTTALWFFFSACLMAYQARMIVGEELLTVGAQKTVFIVMARRFFPPLISGFLLAAIMAASVSTADSQLLVASSSFTADMYQPIVRPEASAKEVLMVGRIAVIIIAIIAYLIASSKGAGAQAIMNLVENAWGLFGAAFGPVILLSLFWRRFNYAGACTGVIIGAAVDIIWLLCCSGTGVYEIVPGFICGGIAAIIVTKISPEPSKEVTDIFDNAIAEGESE